MRKRTLLCDSLAIIISLAVIFAFSLGRFSKRLSVLQVQCDEGVLRYSLDEDRTFFVKGPLGETTVQIKSGKATITDSPCENKNCCSMGGVTKTGGFTACLPNHVLLTLVGSGEAEVDDVAE